MGKKKKEPETATEVKPPVTLPVSQEQDTSPKERITKIENTITAMGWKCGFCGRLVRTNYETLKECPGCKTPIEVK